VGGRTVQPVNDHRRRPPEAPQAWNRFRLEKHRRELPMKGIAISAIAGASLVALSQGALAQAPAPQAPCPPGFYDSGGYCEPRGYGHRDEIQGYGGGRPIGGSACPQGCSLYYYIRSATALDRRGKVVRRLY
jgi:hypothetical protein